MDPAQELSAQIGILIGAHRYHQKAGTPESARYLDHCYAAVATALEAAVKSGACRIK
jgi:hypothetical protein